MLVKNDLSDLLLRMQEKRVSPQGQWVGESDIEVFTSGPNLQQSQLTPLLANIDLMFQCGVSGSLGQHYPVEVSDMSAAFLRGVWFYCYLGFQYVALESNFAGAIQRKFHSWP